MPNGSVVGKGAGLLAVVLLGVLFFNVIIGVFGLTLAIVGLVVFATGAVVISCMARNEGVES